MGKEHANNAHYNEISSLLDAWIGEEEEAELKTTIARIKPLIKVQTWSYVDEQDFSLSDKAQKRKENARREREREYAEYEEENQDGYGEEAQEIEKKEVTEVVAEKSEDNKQEDKKTEDNKTEDNKPEIKPEGEKSAEEKDAPMEDDDAPEELGTSEPKEEREERDDSVYLDDDLFHKLGYGIKSTVVLSSKDRVNQAALHLHYSSHNWDIKDYEKPDFSLFSFSNSFTLEWESPSSNNNNNTTTTTTTTTTTSESTNNESIEVKQTPNLKTLITGTIDGDKQHFSTKVYFTPANLAELRAFLKYDDKDDIFFSEDNFVVLLYFATVAMSIEDQPFNELPALISSKARRFFLKQVLYELGANVNDYRYVIENLSFAMEEIKEQASQDRYSFRGGASSSKIKFDSDDEEEEQSAKRGLDDAEESSDRTRK